MAQEFTITYERGGYRVAQIGQRSACKPCLTGWRDGTLVTPPNGGPVCMHGQGYWQAGEVGKRGGWYGIGPMYRSERAAHMVCDALADAAREPVQGIPQS